MSMIFRGTVEDYDNAGITPSVFIDSSGSLHIYLCDSVMDEIEEDTNIAIEGFETNGGQFVNTIDFNSKSRNDNSKYEM